MTRRTDRRLALLAGGGLALLFTFISAFQVAAWSIGETESSSHRELAGKFAEISVESANGDVTVLRSLDDRVRVDGHSRGTLHSPAPEISVDGSHVRVSANCPVWGFGECQSSVVVHVPVGTSVHVDSGSGDIVAQGVSGGVDLETSSGDIAADGVTGDVSLESGSGDVVSRGLRANLAKAKTASGDVDLRFAAPPKAAEAVTSSGDARILVPPGPEGYNVSVDSGSGETDVGVRQDSDSTRFLRAETSSGDAIVDYGG
jgi:hypothetical protein